MRIPVNRTKAILASATAVFFLGYGAYYAVNRLWPGAAVFLSVGAVFGWLLYRYASVLTVDAGGVRLSFLGIPRRRMAWSDIREVGLIGENVFNRGKKGRAGDRYIYFSPVQLTPDERFRMIVRWPPRDKLYAEYSEKALEYIMTCWRGELMTYNVEDLFPNTGEPGEGP